MNALADAIEDSDLLPEAGDVDAPILRGVDVEENATGRMRDHASWQNVDTLAREFGSLPVSTFRADDAGSWLRVSVAG
jgi:hypothetical protein